MSIKKPSTLSLCMIVKNEEKLLSGCLENVRSIANEIIIIDTGSKDNTVKIARFFGTKIFFHRWKNNYQLARNEYLKKASCDWILALDADERIGYKDLDRLRKLLLNKGISGYTFPIRNYIDNSNILREWRPSNGEYPKEEICSGWFPTKVLRLFLNQKGIRYDGCLVSPNISESILKLGGRIEECSIPIHHHVHLKYSPFDEIKKKQLHYLELSLRSLKIYPKNANIYFKIGEILFQYKKDYASSAPYLKKAIRLQPEFLRSYWLLSLIYQKQKKYDKAERILKAALDINSEQAAQTYCLLGQLYLKQLDLPKATVYLKKAIRIKPHNPTSRNVLGVAYEIQGKLARAINEYKKAIAINKKHPDAYYNLRHAYSSLRQSQKAIGI